MKFVIHNGLLFMIRAYGFVPVVSILICLSFHYGEAGVRPVRGGGGGTHGQTMGAIVPRTVIVKVRSGALERTGSLEKAGNSLPAVLTRMGASAMHQMFPWTPAPGKMAPYEDVVGLSRVYSLAVHEGIDPAAFARALAILPGIEYAEPKYYHQIYDSPNDPLLASQTEALTRLNVYNGWSVARGTNSVIIADVDGGTDWRHEDLLANVHINSIEDINHDGVFDAGDLNGVDDDGNGFVDDAVGWNFTNNTNDPSGVNSAPGSSAHGTATASHFGAVTNNGKGMAGSSWNCAIMPVCAASATGDNLIAYGYEGIAYAFHNGAKVINCSWGRRGGYSQFEQDVITAAVGAGVLVVAAAGNEAANNDIAAHYPSNYTGVLAVGATNSTDDAKAYFSNYGKTVQVFAPGVNILSAFAGGGYGNGGSGTSYSSPLTAGLAGILRGTLPAWTPSQIAAQIRTTADPIDNVNPAFAGDMGRGRVNFARALTESHPALDLADGELQTTGGRKLFLTGDTLVLSLRLKNVLFVPANGCQVVATVSDPALQVINGVASVGSVGVGEEVEVPAMMFRVGTLPRTQEVALRVDWTYNTTERDGAAFRAMLFPAVPLWMLQLDGSSASLYSVCAASKDVIWASGGNGSGSSPLVARSTNGGMTWSDVTGDLSGTDFYCVNALDDQRAWVGTSEGRIYATSNGGSGWSEQVYPGRQSSFINAIRMFPDGTGYALGDPPGDGKFVVLKTQDFGGTWAHLVNAPGLSSTEAGWNNSFWWSDMQHGWFGTNKNRVWRTTDGGATWSYASTGGTNSYGVAFNDATTGYAVHDNGYVARSTDGGVTWGAVDVSTTEQMAAVTCVSGGQAAWAATGSSPFHTRDNGATWAAETLYPFSGSITHVSFADTSVGWAVTTNGEILRYSTSALTGIGEHPAGEVPREFALEQNYPNPFNPVTTIRYTVAGSGREAIGTRWVRLAVYDLLGREVAVLVNESRPPGAYSVAFDGSRLASGMYFYRLLIDGSNGADPQFISTKRMLLLR
jgi:photosystem II stability/assembly factor-like uncharacterized protein